MTNYEMVRRWHLDFGAEVADSPCLLPPELQRQRIALIQEEWDEYLDAVSCGDIIEAADALGDLLWVVYGGMLNHGFDADAVVAEIARSNNTKMGADGKPIVNENGKILKGPAYEPPRLEEVLRDARRTGPAPCEPTDREKRFIQERLFS